MDELDVDGLFIVVLAFLDEGVRECLLRGDSLSWVPDQHSGDEVFGVLVYPLGELEVAVHDQLEGLGVSPAVEGRLSEEQDVQDDAARPHVAFLGVVVVSEHLRSNVVALTH